MINPTVFKAYDIRGVYPTELNEGSCEIIIKSIAHFFKSKLKKDDITIVLGRDMRISSPSLFETARRTLVAEGITVVDIALAPTPTFYFAVLKYKYDAGICITASHNPKEYAGIKFVLRDGSKIIKIGKLTGMDEIKALAMKGEFPQSPGGGQVIKRDDVLDDEIEEAAAQIDISKIKPFKVACDPANGMGALYVKKLFEKVGAELITMNFDLDGTFPAHPADPLDYKNLEPLQDKLKEVGADLGIEPDGDGDRVFFIDEEAHVIPATLITSLIAREALQDHPGAKIIVDVRYTRNVENAVRKYGGEPIISRVGHAFITEDVNRRDAYFAGESSGHFYFGQTGGAESAVRVILYVLKAMSEENKPISKIVEELRTSEESGEYNFIADDPDRIITAVKDSYKDGHLSELDGIAVSYEDWRFSIRASNTEPLLRLNVEGKSEELTKLKLEELTKKILEAGAKEK